MADQQQRIADVAERIRDGVVGIGRRGRGTGFAVGPDLVVTNAHNLPRDVTTVTLAPGRHVQGTVLAADHEVDLAVVRVEQGGLTPLPWADATPSIGAAVLAAAAPQGSLRVTAGQVAAVDARMRTATGSPVAGVLEHTAPLARGASGGPVLDLDGRVVAIDSNRLEGGLYQAIPATPAVRARLDALARGEVRHRPRLGVAITPPRQARHLRAAVGLDPADGLLVSGVEDDSPAARAGLSRGDLLVRAGDRVLVHPDELFLALDDLTEGAPLHLTVLRGVTERTVDVAL